MFLHDKCLYQLIIDGDIDLRDLWELRQEYQKTLNTKQTRTHIKQSYKFDTI